MAKRILPTPEQLRQLCGRAGAGSCIGGEAGVMFSAGNTSAAAKQRKAWNRDTREKKLILDKYYGYRQGAVFDRMYQAHRVIWAIRHGRWPTDQIDPHRHR